MSIPNRSIRIAFVCEGDAEHPDRAFSGTAHRIVLGLRRLGHHVVTCDVELYGFSRIVAALLTFSPRRARWRWRFRLSKLPFILRSMKAKRSIKKVKPDVIVQIGATFDTDGANGVPTLLYCDWNMALAIRHSSFHLSPATLLRQELSREINLREASVYRTAERIFAISDRLKSAFVSDYGIPESKVITAHPGVNTEIRVDRAVPWELSAGTRRPTILFVGKEFERKGGIVLLEAFQLIRKVIANARLVIIGPTALPANSPLAGVESIGPLSRSNRIEHQQFNAAFGDADVFCLPSLYEPLGIVVLEAMSAGIPCVVSDTWALPEMVQDGENGRVVPAGDVDALARALLDILLDAETAKRMGDEGIRRIKNEFSWDLAVSTINKELSAFPAKVSFQKR